MSCTFYTGHARDECSPGYMVKVGVDEFAQKRGGDLLLVRLFSVGKDVKRGRRFGMLGTAPWNKIKEREKLKD